MRCPNERSVNHDILDGSGRVGESEGVGVGEIGGGWPVGVAHLWLELAMAVADEARPIGE